VLGGLRFPWGQIPLLLLVLFLTAAAFSAIGILSASYCVLFKKGNPLALVLALASSLLGGVYFPSDVLPHWLASLCAWVPMTPCLVALRGVLLQGKGLVEVARPMAILGVWGLAGIPLACLCFTWAVARARQKGTLGQY
jgi:ABC-2 type transport system permease protein